MAIAKVQYKENASATPEVWMDTTQKTVTAGTMLSGTTALKNDGTGITGNIASKSSSDLTASGATVTAPAGYYPNAASKSVATTTHPNPTASINAATGVVTASHTQTAGYVAAGTTTGTLPLTTQAAKTVAPTESEQTAVSAGVYTTGAVKVGAIPSTYVGSDVAQNDSSDLTASGATVTAPAGFYAESASKTVASGSASIPATSITANPTISVNASGLITASVSGSKSVTPTVSAGYVSSGTAGTISVTGSNTEQLSTQAGTTIMPTESEQTAVASGKYTTGAVKVGAISSTYVGSGITQRDSTDLTASGATVTAPAGYYATEASKSVASGTAGTPTATKGTVSNHSISVTPSVTNTTGYITGSTINGTAVTVDVTELESGTKSITANGTGISVSGYSAVDVDVASGGGSWDATHISTLIMEVGTSAVTINLSMNPNTMIVAVNWGDGVIDEATTNYATMSHTYSTGGIKNIAILADDSQVASGYTPQYVLRDYCVNQSSSVADYSLKSVYYSPINMPSSGFDFDVFRNCKGLLTAFLAEGTPVVNYRWFRDCSSLLYAYIPSTVTAINNYAFYNSSLKELVIKATTPPTLGTSVFPSTLEKITVPSTSLTDYQTATNWSAYSNIMVGE